MVFSPKKLRGRFEDRIELVFEDPNRRQRFVITRPIHVTVGTKEDYEALKAKVPYVRHKQQIQEPVNNFIPGIPPPALGAIKWVVKLGVYAVPKDLVEVAYGIGRLSDTVSRVQSSILPATFDNGTYANRFHTLLWLEEEQARFA